jgi:phosphoenolpyruvate synthase/pyruvate phosphate dikinase
MLESQKKNAASENELTGFAVSPGRISAPANVILSLDDFDQWRPNTILVCPTTTPAWTALIAEASGLVTDVGAVLAHGSIVAREFGIPATLGTGNATQGIETGQMITVDGSQGTVSLHPLGTI